MMVRHFLHRTLRWLSILFLGTLVWAGWYLHFRGFGKEWRQFVCDEFSKRGVELSMQRLTLDPMEGLVARDVRLFEKNDRRKSLAYVNRLALDLSVSNLIQHQPFLNAVDLREAEVTIPLESTQDHPLVARKLNARILFPPHQIYVSQAEAEILGVNISATGRLNNPEQFHLKKAPEKSSKEQEPIQKYLALLQKIQFHPGNTKLQVRFGGDLAQPDKIFAEASFGAEDVRFPGYRLDSLTAMASFRDGVCSLKQLSARDPKGTLKASGDLNLADKSWQGQVRSTLSLQNLGELLGPTNPDIKFFAPPVFEVSAHGNPESGVCMVGKLALGRFGLRTKEFDGLQGSFSVRGKDWFVRDLRLVHPSGELDLSAMQVPGKFRAKLLSTINPGVFAPMLSGKPAEIFKEWEFLQSPEATLNVTGTSADLLSCEAVGQIRLGYTRLRGIPLKAATATIRVKDRAFSYENFRVEREEGVATGNFTYDFGKNEVRLNQIKTHVIPWEVARWIDLKLVKDVSPYKFKSPPNLSINGVVQTHGGKQTNLEILVDAPEGMDYVFLKKNLSCQKISGHLLFTDGRLRISNLQADLYSGQLRGNADISLRREDPSFSAQMQVEKVDFPSLTKIYFNYDTAKGELTGKYNFSGRGDNARLMQGVGELKVLEGNVFSIPIFGPLSGVMSSILPGVGYDVAHEAHASFKISKGVIDTSDFLVKGRGFSMLGAGKLYFLDDKMDFAVRINAQGVPGAILFPVSKLFEYSSEGSLSKPVWHAKRLPGL